VNDSEKSEKIDEEDVRARFPDPDEVRVPRRDMPEPPKAEFEPPTLPKVEPFRRGRYDGPDGGGSPATDIKGTGLALTIGIQLFASIAGGFGLGLLLDRYVFKTSPQGVPWGLILGFMLGMASGIWTTVRLVRQLNRES